VGSTVGVEVADDGEDVEERLVLRAADTVVLGRGVGETVGGRVTDGEGEGEGLGVGLGGAVTAYVLHAECVVVSTNAPQTVWFPIASRPAGGVVVMEPLQCGWPRADCPRTLPSHEKLIVAPSGGQLPLPLPLGALYWKSAVNEVVGSPDDGVSVSDESAVWARAGHIPKSAASTTAARTLLRTKGIEANIHRGRSLPFCLGKRNQGIEWVWGHPTLRRPWGHVN